MSGKAAGGLVLILAGVVALIWGIMYTNSLQTQLANAFGAHDNTGPLAIGAGIVLGIIGLVLIVKKPQSTT
jgi:hypothetical protein